jgi:hypothetical protein
MLLDVLVERDLVAAVAPSPPPVAVSCLIDRNSIDPRPQRGLATEAPNRPEHLKKHVLRQVPGIFVVPEQVQGEQKNHALVFGHYRRARIRVTFRASADEHGFATGNVRPA